MRIMVTGAAGLIGAQVSQKLALRGHQVSALIHNKRPKEEPRARPGQLIVGDVGAPRLGLADADYDSLSRRLDLVVHCSAVTAFAAPSAAHQRVNVDGTANILALAAAADCPVLHLSTAYVCGGRDGEVSEDRPIARDGFANSYEASKAAAERLLIRARAHGARIAIARPSIVMGDWATGEIDDFCDVYRFIRLIAEGRIRLLPVDAAATLDFVPLDHVVRGVVALAEAIDQAEGRSFHLVSGAPVPVSALTETIGAFDGLHRARLIAPDVFPLNRLTRSEQRLHLSVTALYQAYLKRSPRFRDDNLRALTGLSCPPVDGDYFQRLIRFALRQGLIRPADRAA